MGIKIKLEKLEQLGIKLWVEGSKLKFKAPSGVMSESIKQEIRDNKEEIVAYLKEQSAPVHKEEDRYKPFDLTDIQASYLLGSTNSYGYGGVGCKVYAQLKTPKLEIEKLQKAWEQVIQRHDMLRVVMHQNGTQQVMQSVIIPPIGCIDLSSEHLSKMDEELKRIEKTCLSRQYKPEEWPLYDIVLVQGKAHDIICLTVDMLIADFMSIKIIVTELAKYYYEEETPEELQITFQDFLRYQQDTPHKKNYEAAKAYWCNKSDCLPEAPELPILNSSDEETSIVFEQYNYMVSNEKWEKISDLGKRYELTPSNIVLTAYAQVLGLWSRQLDYTINVTMANRPDSHKDIFNMVGDFTTVNLLEVHLGGRRPFLEQAREIQQQLWSDLMNNQFSGIEVMRELNRQGDKNRLFPIVFTSTIGVGDKKEKDKFELVHKISQTPQVWIDCQISTQENGVLINWDVRKNIFPEGLIRQAFNSLLGIIEDLIKDTSDWSRYTPLKLDATVAEIRKKINDTKGNIWQELLYDGIVEKMKNNPNDLAVVYDKTLYTYEQLGLHALAVQGKLCAKGVKPGDIVAIDLDKGIWQVAAILGTLWAGAMYLPLDREQPDERKKIILENASARYLIAHNNSKLSELQKVFIEELELPKCLELQPIKVLNTQSAYIIYTSGSTGIPKGVVISHQAALNTIRDINSRYTVTNRDKVLALANVAFDLSVYDLFGILDVGGAMVIPRQDRLKEPQYWEEMMVNNQVTIWNSVPAQMQMLLLYAQGIHTDRQYKLRLALLSGDWIPVTLPSVAVKIFDNLKLVSLGGATEAAIWSIYYDIDPQREYVKSIPYGYPLKNQSFRVLNKNMNDCPNWVIGELYIGGIGLAEKYLNDKEQTENSFIIHPDTGERLYRTGDIGRYGDNGIIEFWGREDTQVKINGHRIELSEIESNIQKMDDVESCVAVISQEMGTENSIIAFVQPEAIENITLNTTHDELEETIRETVQEVTSSIDLDLFAEWTKSANQTAVYDIYACLKGLGVFTEDRKYSVEEMHERIKIHPKYQQLLRRWLNVLCTEQVITYDANKKGYSLINKDIPVSSNKASWEKWWEIERKMNYNEKLVSYFQSTSRNLPGLLNGDVDPLDLFFPQGKQDIAVAAYHDNIISQAMNKVMVSSVTCLREICKRENPKHKFRILELGAGVGGVSLDIIPTLEGENVEYIFSDISQYFLNEAKIKFKKYDFISYQLFDINKPFGGQGVEPSAVDVIICNNVLHNAKRVQDVLRRLREILIEEGTLILAETTGENYSLLTSVEFHGGLGETEDFRKDKDQVFLTSKEWIDLFEKENIALGGMFPRSEDALSRAHQTVFVGQYIPERKKIDTEVIMETLKQKIPKYMLPNHIEIVHTMPLTQNGKVHRQQLIEHFIKEQNPFVATTGEEVEGELEKALEKIWAKALNREYIFRNENFYQAGGDSLLVAQVVAEMKENIPQVKDWDWDTLMREIIQTPTIREVAAKVTTGNAQDSSEESQNKNLIIFSEGKNKKRIKVLFHDGTGTITPYQHMLPYLTEVSTDDEAIVGLVNGDINEYLSYTEDALIQNLGTKYGTILAELDYEEYELIGYCFGSMVAVEAAKYLMQEGKKLKPILTIDTPSCDHRIKSEFLMERTYGMSMGVDVAKCGYASDEKLLKQALLGLLKNQNKDIRDEDLCALSGEYAPIAECFKELASQSQEDRLFSLYESLIDQIEEKSNYSKEKIESVFQVTSLSFAAMGVYRELFIGDVIELYCENESINFFPMLEGTEGGFWQDKVLGNLEAKAISGNHNTCMREPVVKEIVRKIYEATI